MTPSANFHAHHMIQQKAHAHGLNLTRWANQVCQSHRVLDAARIAAQPPAAPSLVRSLSALYRSQELRAKTQIEQALRDKIAQMSVQDPEWHTVFRLMRGHWPRLYTEMERRARNT